MAEGNTRKVSDVMETPISTGPDTNLLEAARIMRDRNIGDLPIVQNGRLIGIVTDRDIVVRAVAEQKDIGACKVSDIASKDLVTGAPSLSLADAARLMADHQVRRLLIVENEQLRGVISMQDVAQKGGAGIAGQAEKGITEQ